MIKKMSGDDFIRKMNGERSNLLTTKEKKELEKLIGNKNIILDDKNLFGFVGLYIEDAQYPYYKFQSKYLYEIGILE